jgi:hypothetical protein
MENANDEPERTPELNGLVESVLSVENLAFACGFYEQVLGLGRLRPPGARKTGKRTNTTRQDIAAKFEDSLRDFVDTSITVKGWDWRFYFFL